MMKIVKSSSDGGFVSFVVPWLGACFSSFAILTSQTFSYLRFLIVQRSSLHLAWQAFAKVSRSLLHLVQQVLVEALEAAALGHLWDQSE